jgi:serum/glucocorticoid-regulated kinase 2
MLQILSGLDYLHNNNILFRDIKLENILFDLDGKLKITDFGLSKPDINEDEITYSYCGSPEYMAPEMLAKSGHSYEVDFYALGILLYELLFGRSPFYAPKK